MTFKICRRGSARCIGLLSAFVTILVCLYYISIGQPSPSSLPSSSNNKEYHSKRFNEPIHYKKNNNNNNNSSWHNWVQNGLNMIKNGDDNDIKNDGHQKQHNGKLRWEKCAPLENAETDITTLDEYAKFDFQPEWMKTKEYWDKSFESRFEEFRKDNGRPPLKVIIVPHSHNDPGWLKTYMSYFLSDSRTILNSVITKMQEYTDMTFIWTEISILQLWWDQAHPTKQRALKRLIQSGRFEITTGGWVMTDEANVHLYAMLDQLIEGHQWVKTNLNVTPETGWSIDPFGHGSTVPYLLANSGFKGTIIQRIHYAWKQWFAKHRSGDFLWSPYWSPSSPPESGNEILKNGNDRTDEDNFNNNNLLLTHNMPFDIYSIKHSCGPHPFVCLNFDFRKIPGEYTEYSIKAQFITDENVQAKSDLLMEQYARTASLFPHNVALIPIGDDFRYNREREIEQQYTNYKKLIDYINNNPERYKTEIGFGLPRDYFRVVRERFEKFPTLKGDFFVYSDIFTEGRPAYWSGYFTTRPAYKILSRELEHNIRCLEILFTIAFNIARQHQYLNALRIYEKNYEKLIMARRNLGLFQHHDAITGTSKANVMRDYGQRLFESIQDTVRLQESTIELLLQNAYASNEHKFILNELERETFNKLPRKSPIYVTKNQSFEFVVFNSLAQERFEIILIRSQTPTIRIFNGNDGQEMNIQINPVWNITDLYDGTGGSAIGGFEFSASGTGTAGVGNTANNNYINNIIVSDRQYEIMFLAKLPPLSLVTFTAVHTDDNDYLTSHLATLYCNDCKDTRQSAKAASSSSPPASSNVFNIKNKQPGDIQLENYKMRLLFDEKSGFLKTITPKNMGRPIQCAIKFGAYHSAQFHSGAYLFKTDPERVNDVGDKGVLDRYPEMKILITSGPIASDVTVIYGPFLAHTIRIFNTKTILDKAIFIENDIDFETPPKNRETELYMRIQTDIENGELPEIYTDLNGFQFQKRIKVPAIGVEGNYFPITSAAFIQDERLRLTLLTTHAQGAASLEPGQLEMMIDRRMLYDDYRGMGEGVVDSRFTRHKYWMILEEFAVHADAANGNGNGDGDTIHNSQSTIKDYQTSSLFVNHLTNAHNYPANIYFLENQNTEQTKLNLSKSIKLLQYSFPCDSHLISLRTLTEDNLPLFPSRSALLILQRQANNGKFKDDTEIENVLCGTEERTAEIGNGKVVVVVVDDDNAAGGTAANYQTNNLFKKLQVEQISSTTLTGLKTHDIVKDFSKIKMKPMDIRTFNVTFFL